MQIKEEINVVGIYAIFKACQVSGNFSQMLNGWTANDIIILSDR